MIVKIAALVSLILVSAIALSEDTEIIELVCSVTGVTDNMSQEQSKESWRIDEGNGTALQMLSVDATHEWDICDSPDNKFVLKFSGKCDDRSSMVKAVIYRDGKYELRAISFQSDGALSENVIFVGTCARKNKVW